MQTTCNKMMKLIISTYFTAAIIVINFQDIAYGGSQGKINTVFLYLCKIKLDIKSMHIGC